MVTIILAQSNSFVDFLMRNQSIVINVHYIFFLLAYSIRLYKHRNDGVISIQEARPKSFWLKVVLQSINTVVTFAKGYEADESAAGFVLLSAFLYLVCGIIWILSIHLQFFEYGRSLPHRWYAHQIFWILSSIVNAATISLKVLNDPNFKSPFTGWEIWFLVTHSVACAVSLLLSGLGIFYSHDQPQSQQELSRLRNKNKKKLGKILENDFLSRAGSTSLLE